MYSVPDVPSDSSGILIGSLLVGHDRLAMVRVVQTMRCAHYGSTVIRAGIIRLVNRMSAMLAVVAVGIRTAQCTMT